MQGERNKRLSKAGNGSEQAGVENKIPLGFDCSDCLNFRLDLAKAGLEFYQKRSKEDPMDFEQVKVLGASFLNSWARNHRRESPPVDIRHISFSAKPKNKNNGYDGVWFFAELIEVEGELRPIRCEILNPSVTGPTPHNQEILYGCGFCPFDQKFPHPPQEKKGKFSKKYPCRNVGKNRAVDYKHRHRPVKYMKHREGKERNLSELEAAEIALTCGEMDSEYEVEKVAFLEKMPFSWVQVEGTDEWYHVGFTATAKNSSRTERFFGELRFDAREKDYLPTCCVILGDSGVERGCGFCPEGEHPIGRYLCGAWRDPPPLDLSDDSDYEHFFP